MEIICPTCNTRYKIPATKVPAKGATVICKKCGGQIAFHANNLSDVGLTLAKPGMVEHPEQAPRDARPSNTPWAGSTAAEPFLMDFPELKSLDPQKFALEEILLPNKKGAYRTRQNKHKVKVLMAVQDVLPKIVKTGERVLRVGQGIAHHPLEALFGNGVLTMMYNQYAIMCTNQRVLFVNTNYRMNHPSHYYFQMPYDEITKVKAGLTGGRLILRRVNKRGARIFTGMKRYLTRELVRFIDWKTKTVTGAAARAPETLLENLCPACFSPLQKGLVNCTHCQAGFKEPRKAFLKSLAVPGWGDLYLGHRALGSIELLGSLGIWAIAASNFVSGHKESGLIVLLFLIFYNGVDGILAYHMAKKGYMTTG